MTLEEIDKIIIDLRNQIPSLQVQLHQAEGYKQALVEGTQATLLYYYF